MSLKDELYNLIKNRGFITYGEMCQFVSEQGYKISNAERRLREMEGIEPDISKSKRGTKYISGYRFKPLDSYTAVENTLKEVIPQLFTYKVHDPITKFRDPN